MLEVSVICVWLGCLSAYLASENQKFIAIKLKKRLGWVGFIALISGAIINACIVYSLIISLLIVFTLVMLCWVCIVIFNGHKSLRVLPVGIILFLAISILIRIA